jgi:PhnB protein
MKARARESRVSFSPVLAVKSVEQEATFLRVVFRAEISMLIHDSDGEAQQAEARIGDSMILLQQASPTSGATRSMMRIPMSDVQTALKLALDNGGESVPVAGWALGGHGQAAVRDPEGNIWWIVPQDRKPSNEEIQRRLTEQRRQRL